MRVLYLTKYSRLGASSRLRSFQYFPYLEAAGIEVKVSPLFNRKYINNLYRGRIDFISILISYLKRFFVLFKTKRYDALIIEKEIFPYLPAWFEFIFHKSKINYIVDYDDAIFHNYDQNKKIIRFFLKNKIRHVMKYSKCVICGNSYLAQYANISGAQKIELIPTVIDIERYKDDSVLYNNTGKTIIGWIGTPKTFNYLKSLRNVLLKLLQLYDVEIYIIGVKNGLDIPDGIKYIDWNESTEVENISKFDIGIMPLKDSDWEKGKCSYKLIQYMACKLPVIASPVGMNKELILNNENGLLASGEKEWFDSFSKYIENPTLRKKHGINGFKRIEKEYCVQTTHRKMTELVNEIIIQ